MSIQKNNREDFAFMNNYVDRVDHDKLKLEEKRVGCWNNSGHPPIELFGIL
ncbi:MAG: hypothetical protein WA667_12755 [Candidatus Nitrosopolaris sp.]